MPLVGFDPTRRSPDRPSVFMRCEINGSGIVPTDLKLDPSSRLADVFHED